MQFPNLVRLHVYRAKKYQSPGLRMGGIIESAAKAECKEGREFNGVFKEVSMFPPLPHTILGGRGEVNHFLSTKRSLNNMCPLVISMSRKRQN